jgi:UDP-glucose 4-epimerase
VRTAIVTGGAGFIGSHVVDALLAAGSQVVVVDDMSSGDPARVAAAAEVQKLDIVEFDALARVVEQAAPEAIYHLAAQASVVESVKDPGRDCEVNVRGTLNVLEAARGCGAPVVFTSTGGALYGDEAPRPTPETQLPSPLSPYGASKLAAEAYVRTWALSSGIPHTVCRLGNVYGPRQSPHGEAGVVAIFSGHLHAGQAPTLYGHGKPTRDYVYVTDVVDAMLAATGREGVYNIATGAETDVLSIWTGLRDAAARVEPGLQPPEPKFADLRAGELQHSCLDVSLAARELGWSARVPIAQGLERTYRALVEEFQKA